MSAFCKRLFLDTYLEPEKVQSTLQGPSSTFADPGHFWGKHWAEAVLQWKLSVMFDKELKIIGIPKN